jgi:hypothetical protein
LISGPEPAEISVVFNKADGEREWVLKVRAREIDCLNEAGTGNDDAASGQRAAVGVLEQDRLEKGRPQNAAPR